jgi:hypothetical protein
MYKTTFTTWTLSGDGRTRVPPWLPQYRVRKLAIERIVRETPSGSPFRRSPAFVCDCFLNSWKRILNEQEKIDLFFRQSTLGGILGQSAALFH